MTTPKTNLHVPLPPELNRKLRAEAKRSGQPATAIAREGIRLLLETRHRQAVHREIAAYARAVAGTAADLDEGMESASIEHLLESEGSDETR